MENTNEILKKINSGEPELIAEAVREIKESGDLTIAEALLDNLKTPLDFHSSCDIVNLLADIKENAFRELLISKLRAASDTNFKSILIRIAWESSLDYSAYLNLFQDILLQDDFAAAFEASTAIEEMVYNLTMEQRASLAAALSSPAIPEDKKIFIENILAELSTQKD